MSFFSPWTIVCIIAMIMGLLTRRWDVIAWALIAYFAGWVLRVVFDTSGDPS